MAQPKLANLALWGQAKAFSEGRAYRHPHTGEQYPSVTTILKGVDKSGLSQWAADQAMLWAAENVNYLLTRSPEDAFNAGRFRWKDVRDERAEVGTGVHETIEALHTGAWTYPELDEEQQAIMAQWALLCEEHRIEPILSEFTVLNPTVGYMGTADGYWRITCLHDGPTCLGQEPGTSVLTVADVKTSRNTWPEHEYQLAALSGAEEWVLETGDMEWTIEPRRQVDAAAIIHLRADSHKIIPVSDLDLKARIFESYAGVWYAKQGLKDREKERAKREKDAVLALGFDNVTPIGGAA